jgi:hypothetical protein
MIDGYSRKESPSFVRTQMDSGYYRQRRRAITTAKTFQQKYRFTQTQLAIFDDWWENEAFAGSAWVAMPVYTGQGKAYVQCHFTDTPDIAAVPDSKITEISVTLETYAKLVPNG